MTRARARWLVAALCLWQLALFGRFLAGGIPHAGDGGSHVCRIHSTARWLEAGAPGKPWCPEFNAGFPTWDYYHPLPYLLLGVLEARLGLDPLWLYNWATGLLWALFPWGLYRGGRWLGLTRGEALAAATVGPLLQMRENWGLELDAVQGLGLFSQAWALPLLPLAVGLQRRFLDRGRPWLAHVLLASALLLLHALAFLVLHWLLAVMLVLGLCRRQPQVLTRGLFALVVVALLSAWKLVPAIATADFHRSPYGGTTDAIGLGLGVLWRLADGSLVDAGRLPLLGLLTLLGLTAIRARPAVQILAGGLGLFVVLLAGQPLLGPLARLVPGDGTVAYVRYGYGLQLCVAWLAGVGLARGASWLRERAGQRVARVAVAALLVPWMGGWWLGQLKEAKVYGTDDPAISLRRASEAMKGDELGRWLVRSPDPLGSPGSDLVALSMPYVYSGRPGLIGMGSGAHDSLGLEYAKLVRHDDPALLDLFGVSHLLQVGGDRLGPPGGDWREIYRDPYYRVYRRPSPGLFASIALVGEVRGRNRETLEINRRWMRSARVARGEHLWLRPDDGPPREGPPRGEGWPATGAGWPGADVTIREARALRSEYRATVDAPEGGLLMLRVSWHPGWRVEVNGRERGLAGVSPCFMATDLPHGERIGVRFYIESQWVDVKWGALSLLTLFCVLAGAVVASDIKINYRSPG